MAKDNLKEVDSWLARIDDLIDRLKKLPGWLTDPQKKTFKKWEAQLEDTYLQINTDVEVSQAQKENIRMAEQAMDGWETTARAGKEDQVAEEQKSKPKKKAAKKKDGKVGKETDKRTEKDVAREKMEDDIIAEARSLVPEAISAAMKGKNVGLTVKVSLKPNKKKGGFDYTVSGGTSAKAAERDRIEISNQTVMY